MYRVLCGYGGASDGREIRMEQETEGSDYGSVGEEKALCEGGTDEEEGIVGSRSIETQGSFVRHCLGEQ
jgi:hypothetical protein